MDRLSGLRARGRLAGPAAGAAGLAAAIGDFASRPPSAALADGASMWRPKIIFPAVVCSTLVTTMSMFLLIIRRALSTTTMVPSSR